MSYFDVDWSHRFTFGEPRSLKNLIGICLHTTENAAGTPAENVATYQINSESGSYNMLVDTTGKRLRANTDDWFTWSTGNKGNSVLLHLSFVAYASWTRAQWLAQDKMLRAGATVVAHWCRTYGFPVKKAVPVGNLPGITTHDATRAWGGTDHTDPGPNFPWDVFLKYVNENMATPKPATTNPITTKEATVSTILTGESAEALNIARIQSTEANKKVAELVRRMDNIESKIEVIASQLVGTGRTKDNKVTYSGWPQLGLNDKGAPQTIVDGLAALIKEQEKVNKAMLAIGGSR